MMARKTRELIKKKGSKNWICQFQWRDENGKKLNFTKSLGTPNKELAWSRYEEINSKIGDIKDGMRFTWSWERQSRHTKIEVRTVADAFDSYIKHQEAVRIKPETIDGSKTVFKRLIKSGCASHSTPIRSLSGIELEDYERYWRGKHAPNTISQSLNKIKAFLNYCVEKGWILKYKKIVSTLTEKPISYFTDDEFQQFMKALPTDELKRAYLFYRETGCRKREPFIARRVGSTLIIPPLKKKKNKTERRIVLSPVLSAIHDEMVETFNKRMEYCKIEKQAWDWYYYKLKETCKKIGMPKKTLHDLRDTYVVRLWAKLGDIHLVSKMINHNDISETVKYANILPEECLEHFPSLEKWLKPRIEASKSLMEGSILEVSGLNDVRFLEERLPN